MSVLSSPSKTREGISRTWFRSVVTLASGLVRRLTNRSSGLSSVDPVDVHLRRLIKLHGDRIDPADRLAAASLATISPDAKQQLIDRINRKLQIEPLITNQITVVRD